jgi:hypothetical protein
MELNLSDDRYSFPCVEHESPHLTTHP